MESCIEDTPERPSINPKARRSDARRRSESARILLSIVPYMKPIACRVVARHRRAAIVLRDVPATVDIIYSEGGVVSGADVARLLHDRLGALLSVRFHPSPSGTPNIVRWEALDERGDVVSGQLVLHAGVRDDQVVVWAEIVISGEHGARMAGGTPEEHILRQRLERIAVLARRMVENARVNPQAPVSGIVEELVRIVDEAEG